MLSRLPTILLLSILPFSSGHTSELQQMWEQSVIERLKTPGADIAAELQKIYEYSKGERLTAPTAERIKNSQELFSKILEGKEVLFNKELLDSLGMSALETNDYIILYEVAEYKRGVGFYVFCKACPPELFLQAPHGFDDRFTSELAFDLLVRGGIKAVALNNTPNSERNLGEPVDLTLIGASIYNALNRVIASLYPRSKVVQLHGFNEKTRSTEAAQKTDFIVSNGTTRPDKRMVIVAQCLDAIAAGRSKVFPVQINELGALDNEQGKLMRAMGHEGFLNLDISMEMRKKFMGDPAFRPELWKCIRK
ncbi:MAG: hypothetical protein AB1810_03245 [Pseudomonadota bacterium]